MGIVGKNDSDENEVQEKKLNFKAKCIKLHKEKDWIEEEVVVENIEGIRGIFSPYNEDVTQINVTKNLKVYTSIGFLEERGGLDGRVNTATDGQKLFVSPILLVECDDYKPIDITEDGYNFLKDYIDLF